MTFTILDNDEAFNNNQSIWMQTDINALIAAINGDGVVSGCVVSEDGGGASMDLDITSGTIQINDTTYSITGSAAAVTIGAADGSNPRIDLVSAKNDDTLNVTAGTAAADPKAANIPANSVLLAMVYVPASDTAIADNQITDKRVIVPLKDVGAHVYDGSSQTISHATATAVNFDTERYDTDAFHDTVTNNTRMTVPSGLGGKYLIGAYLSFAGNATGRRQVRLRLNGSTEFAILIEQGVDSLTCYMVMSFVYQLSATDYVEVVVYQSSGGNLAISQQDFFIQRIG